MNIKNFIEDKILQRGADYVYSIEEVDQVDIGEFSASVEGTSEYNVYVKLDVEDGDIEEHECDCPYDWGDVCKHIVAVLYHIRQNKLHQKGQNGTVASQLRLVVEDMSVEELRDFVLTYAKRDREFREDLISEFG